MLAGSQNVFEQQQQSFAAEELSEKRKKPKPRAQLDNSSDRFREYSFSTVLSTERVRGNRVSLFFVLRRGEAGCSAFFADMDKFNKPEPPKIPETRGGRKRGEEGQGSTKILEEGGIVLWREEGGAIRGCSISLSNFKSQMEIGKKHPQDVEELPAHRVLVVTEG